jgi:K+-sensing histidine kinase KdpD
MSEENKIDFSMLLASSVHDIKNSLGMLLNSLEEMVDTSSNKSPEDKKHYATLRGEASRINNSLIYLLGLYHYESNHLSIHADEIYLLDFLEEQVVAQELLFEINSIDVKINCDPSLSGFFDENLISGVINNILVNDVKYTQDKITLNAFMEDEYLIIEIIDNGDGYPKDILEASVDRNKAIDFSSGSTNLGLYFASVIAELHTCKDKAGRIELSNTDEGGGRFKLYLP